MDRRAFLATVAGGILAAPLAAELQAGGKAYLVELSQEDRDQRLPAHDCPGREEDAP